VCGYEASCAGSGKRRTGEDNRGRKQDEPGNKVCCVYVSLGEGVIWLRWLFLCSSFFERCRAIAMLLSSWVFCTCLVITTEPNLCTRPEIVFRSACSLAEAATRILMQSFYS